MGKAALLFALAAAITTMWLTYATQQTTIDTQDAQTESYSNQMARELAIKGRKLALAGWIQSAGKGSSSPFQTLAEGGGDITITKYAVNAGVLDLTVRAVYEGAVHDIRSQYKWNPGGALNAFQIKATDVNLTVSDQATLNFPSISLDDQALSELDDILVDELKLAGDLNTLGLGIGVMHGHVRSELSNSGNMAVGVDIIDTSNRLQLEQEDGIFFPDQVESALSSYLASNPGKETVLADGNLLPDSFGDSSKGDVLRVKDDLSIDGNFSGSGILVIEGNLIVPDGSTFQWDGLVLMKSAAGNLNPQIDFSGTVNINGGLVALHEAMPNTGHMDVTTFRDINGTWTQPHGAEGSWSMKHTHDFTAHYGNAITYYSSVSSERIHEDAIRFKETLDLLSGNTEVFLKLYNTDAHGRGSLSMELAGEDRVANPVAAGFESSVADPVNEYRTKNFKVSDLEYLHIDILRLSSLKKMWDTEVNYPGCSSTSGPRCVGSSRDRYGSLTMDLYKVVSLTEYKIYEVSMYWHRRTDEIEEFNDKMDQLVEDLQSEDYGLDINIGANTTISEDVGAVEVLMGPGGLKTSAIHLGSWTAHWGPHDPKNPVTVAQGY